jgi:hypothetical protein
VLHVEQRARWLASRLPAWLSVPLRTPALLDAVVVDNQLINIALLTFFNWDGKFLLLSEILADAGLIVGDTAALGLVPGSS